MKKSMYIFGILALLLAGAACNNADNGDPQENELPGIQPIVLADELGTELSEELTAFFEECLWSIDLSLFNDYSETFGMRVYVYTDTCVMINSAEEFQAINFINDMTFELPTIDFDVYTLVIGQYQAPSFGWQFVAQRIVVEPEEITMNILLRNMGITSDDLRPKEYWGLYPKLPQLPIRVIRKFQ